MTQTGIYAFRRPLPHLRCAISSKPDVFWVYISLSPAWRGRRHLSGRSVSNVH